MKKVFLLFVSCLCILAAGVFFSSCKETECECMIEFTDGSFSQSRAQSLVDKHAKKSKNCTELRKKILAESAVKSVSCSER